MNRIQYRNAARAVRVKGTEAIKSMRMRDASTMLRLHFQRTDKLDEKAYVFKLANKYGHN